MTEVEPATAKNVDGQIISTSYASTEQDGIDILDETSENGIRKLRCSITAEGYGVIDWTV
ncbi:MAG: hypothetical protein IJW48_04575 [Clostridia bacterium]|nr:hypothetical protein [Clostridia bacterium]